jgi:hypothetical protein
MADKSEEEIDALKAGLYNENIVFETHAPLPGSEGPTFLHRKCAEQRFDFFFARHKAYKVAEAASKAPSKSSQSPPATPEKKRKADGLLTPAKDTRAFKKACTEGVSPQASSDGAPAAPVDLTQNEGASSAAAASDSLELSSPEPSEEE